MLKEKFNPAIPKRYLFFLAGMMWSLVGLILATVGLFWIFTVKQTHALVLILTPLEISRSLEELRKEKEHENFPCWS